MTGYTHRVEHSFTLTIYTEYISVIIIDNTI
jgi:hypothetical protein